MNSQSFIYNLISSSEARLSTLKSYKDRIALTHFLPSVFTAIILIITIEDRKPDFTLA